MLLLLDVPGQAAAAGEETGGTEGARMRPPPRGGDMGIVIVL